MDVRFGVLNKSQEADVRAPLARVSTADIVAFLPGPLRNEINRERRALPLRKGELENSFFSPRLFISIVF